MRVSIAQTLVCPRRTRAADPMSPPLPLVILILIVAIEGDYRIKRIDEKLEGLEEGRRQNAVVLERLETEQGKLGQQQIRETIVLEEILASVLHRNEERTD